MKHSRQRFHTSLQLNGAVFCDLELAVNLYPAMLFTVLP